MRYPLLSDDDKKAIDALKAHHGGAEHINKTIEAMRDFETRKGILAEKGFGQMIDEAETRVKAFPKVKDFEKENAVQYNSNFGTARSQVSGFQGAKVTHRCIQRIAEGAESDEPCYCSNEMISIVALTDNYVYNGDLLATLTMAENIMGVSKFCNTNLIGIPQPESRFKELESVTGKTFERMDAGNGNSQLLLKNQGTFFGNFGGSQQQPSHLSGRYHPDSSCHGIQLLPESQLEHYCSRLLLRPGHPQPSYKNIHAALNTESHAVPDAAQHHE